MAAQEHAVPKPPDKGTLLAVLQFLKRNNLKGTEELLKKEAGVQEEEYPKGQKPQTSSDVTQALAAYKSEGDPSIYADRYTTLKSFVERSLDSHKCEMFQLLYPVFVQMYLELVYNSHETTAKLFFEKFAYEQESYYQDDLARLMTVSKPEHMTHSQLMDNFRTNKFVIRMSRDSYTHLKRHLQSKHTQLLNIIQEHLFIDVFDGVPRNKQQIDATAGGISGEAKREANKTKVYYGLLKEPDINIPLDDDEEESSEGDKPKKKKAKKEALLMKKSKTDPNAPNVNRIPLPSLKDADKMDKVNAFREALKRTKIGKDSPPTICFYTFLNSFAGVSSVDISEDSSLLSAGFSDSDIRVWSLTPNRLRAMKPPEDLNDIDKEADDILERMMDDRTASDSKTLQGHTGPVYATSFSRDRNELISCSEDGTVRLWNLQTWCNLVCYKGHIYPVWDVKFSPQGHYFVSVGHDRLARLWVTDHHQPIRMFAGHLSDIDSVEFHPNCNYIATGSSDRTVKLWDVNSGKCVRTMTGHKAAVHKLLFSPDGRYLASAGVDKHILLWDMANGNLVGQLKGHTDTVYALSFSREGTILASGGLDNCVKLWDVAQVFKNQDIEGDVNVPSNINFNENYEIGSYPTKNTPVHCVHFTRRNLLLASGPYVPS